MVPIAQVSFVKFARGTLGGRLDRLCDGQRMRSRVSTVGMRSRASSVRPRMGALSEQSIRLRFHAFQIRFPTAELRNIVSVLDRHLFTKKAFDDPPVAQMNRSNCQWRWNSVDEAAKFRQRYLPNLNLDGPTGRASDPNKPGLRWRCAGKTE
jgi:hypothetical protein